MDLLLKQEEISGTVLEEVSNVTAKEIAVAKTELAKTPIEEGDRLCSSMTELEKQIFAVIVKKDNELKEKSPFGSDSFFAAFDRMFDFKLSFGQEGTNGINFTELKALKRDIDFLKSWMRYLIQGRIGMKKSFVLRAGFQVALLKEQEDEDDNKSCETGNHKTEDNLCDTLCTICLFRDICPESSYKTIKTEE